jgi:pimeloyl-ACP methyl ester carboxylesterase
VFDVLLRFRSTLEDARRITGYLVDDIAAFEEHIQARYANSLIPGHWEALESARLRNPDIASSAAPTGFLESLRECDAQLLMVEGQSDVLMERGWAEHLAAYAPNARAVSVPGGHSPQLEHPLEVLTPLLDFLAEVDQLGAESDATAAQPRRPTA